MHRIAFWCAASTSLALTVVTACTNDDDHPAIAAADAAIVDAPAVETSLYSNPGTCPANQLCFNVESVRSGTTPLAGNLIVVWSQLNDDGPDPAPKIAYRAPFVATDASITIPLSEIEPPDEPNLFCNRACTDEAACPCLGDPKVGIGYVVVVPLDSDGGINGWFGIANMALAYSDKEYKPAPAATPGVFQANDRLFPDGILSGVHGYSLVRPEGGAFDRLGVPPPNTVFTLSVCDSTDRNVCKPKGPNLS